MSQLSLFETSLPDMLETLCQHIAALDEDERIAALNQTRQRLHQISPFKDEPVDTVLWVKADDVIPNDYNPNTVASPEFALLLVSIEQDHYTQPVVVHQRGPDDYVIIDGEHRYKAGRQPILARRLRGYIPVTVANTAGESERRTATVRHNRARGIHKLDSMSDIVLALRQDGWPDDKIGKHLGMDADEILRMKQVSGIALAYAQPAYNRAWINDNGQSELAELP